MLDIRILSWNITGLGTVDKRSKVQDQILSAQPNVVLLQETKISNQSLIFLRQMGGKYITNWEILDSNGASGGLLIGWNEKDLEKIEVVKGKYSLSINFKMIDDNSIVAITNVYGPSIASNKQEFLREIKSLQTLMGDKWVLGGDFNMRRFTYESSKRGPIKKIMVEFNKMITQLNMHDLPPTNIRFTWSNLRAEPSMATLDRFLISSDWEALFPLSCCEGKARTTSDHSPILLTTQNVRKGSSYFKLEKKWLKSQEFTDIVDKVWNTTVNLPDPFFSIANKLRCMKKEIKEWVKCSYNKSRGDKKALESEILGLDIKIDRCEMSERDHAHRRELIDRYADILNDEEITWKQRSRITWLNEGDSNTSFFHKISNGNFRRSRITSLCIDGILTEDKNDIARTFVLHYQNQFNKPYNTNIHLNWGEICQKKIPNSDLLQENFRRQEIDIAVRNLQGDKSPGPDGFPNFFFKTYWELVKQDVYRMFEYLQLNRDLSSVRFINQCFITLLPKKLATETVNDFRPISLLNSCFKIITKVLATRLSTALIEVIDNTQSAFLKGRKITDCYIAAHETMHHMHKHKVKGFIFKLDFEKAFDNIKWSFLLDALKGIGCGDKWIPGSMQLYPQHLSRC